MLRTVKKFSFFLARLGRLRRDDPPLPGHPLHAVDLQQGQVRGHRQSKEGLRKKPLTKNAVNE